MPKSFSTSAIVKWAFRKLCLFRPLRSMAFSILELEPAIGFNKAIFTSEFLKVLKVSLSPFWNDRLFKCIFNLLILPVVRMASASMFMNKVNSDWRCSGTCNKYWHLNHISVKKSLNGSWFFVPRLKDPTKYCKRLWWHLVDQQFDYLQSITPITSTHTAVGMLESCIKIHCVR